MSREPQDVIKAQLGSLMVEIAILTAKLEAKHEEIVQLKTQQAQAAQAAKPAKELPSK